MSEEKAWYEGLTGEDLAGKHVHVVFKTGTVVDGRLEWDGLMYVSRTRQIAVLGPAKGGSWELSPGVESVSLVWDERDWEQIPIDDAEEGDVLVIGESKENIFEIHGKKSADRWWTINNDEDSCITPDMISCVLRKRSKLPTEPGTYRGADGTLLFRLDCPRERWMCVSVGSSVSGAYVDDEVAEKYLPLSPVHFVDGRAE